MYTLTPMRPLTRIDLHSVKQELHDALGEDGLPYWKALGGYLLGQYGRDEMESLVRGWLKGKNSECFVMLGHAIGMVLVFGLLRNTQTHTFPFTAAPSTPFNNLSPVELHNRLLLALLHNASVPSHPLTPSSPLSSRKRKRVGPDDPEYDVDENVIEPKSRVHQWMLGLSGKERARVRRAVMRQEQQGEEENVWGTDKKKLSLQSGECFRTLSTLRTNLMAVTMPSLAASGRVLPSAHQMSHRLSQIAQAYDLSVSSDNTGDIGEFLAVGLDAHLSDILHALVHLTGRDRPGLSTIHVPDPAQAEVKEEIQTGGSIPKTDLETMRDLFVLKPGLNPATSPAVYKLESNVTLAEKEYNSPAQAKGDRKHALTRSHERADEVATRLVEAGLVRLDTAKEEKKDKKHSWHWKYEDPAVVLESVLG